MLDCESWVFSIIQICSENSKLLYASKIIRIFFLFLGPCLTSTKREHFYGPISKEAAVTGYWQGLFFKFELVAYIILSHQLKCLRSLKVFDITDFNPISWIHTIFLTHKWNDYYRGNFTFLERTDSNLESKK